MSGFELIARLIYGARVPNIFYSLMLVDSKYCHMPTIG